MSDRKPKTWYGRAFAATFPWLREQWKDNGTDRSSRTKGKAPPRPQPGQNSISQRAMRNIRHPNHWRDPDGR
jgi:hypothetical protein